MTMPGRKYSQPNSGYRYGFNGKELDKDMDGNNYDYGFRIYNPALGRFLSTDPLTREYPWYTPYQFAGNTPIQAIDLDGLEPEFIIGKNGKLTKPMIALFSAAFGYSQVEMQNTHWKKTNTSFNAQTIYHTIKYGARTDLDKFDNTEMWTDFWFNLTVHEYKHRTEYSGIGSWLKWTASYLAMTAVEDSKEHDPKFYSHNTPAEKRAYGIEQPMVELMNFQNSLALKALESSYDESTKVGIMQYVGTSFNLQKEQGKLNNLNTKQSTFDGTKKQARKLEKQIKRQEKIVQALSNEVNNLKTKYGNEISELDKKQGREVKMVASPTK
jgi:RHS repeat-associated protein